MAVAIVTDTCHYLPKELLAAHSIREVSLYIHWDGRATRESEITDYDGYYERLRTATGLPSLVAGRKRQVFTVSIAD